MKQFKFQSERDDLMYSEENLSRPKKNKSWVSKFSRKFPTFRRGSADHSESFTPIAAAPKAVPVVFFSSTVPDLKKTTSQSEKENEAEAENQSPKGSDSTEKSQNPTRETKHFISKKETSASSIKIHASSFEAFEVVEDQQEIKRLEQEEIKSMNFFFFENVVELPQNNDLDKKQKLRLKEEQISLAISSVSESLRVLQNSVRSIQTSSQPPSPHLSENEELGGCRKHKLSNKNFLPKIDLSEAILITREETNEGAKAVNYFEDAQNLCSNLNQNNDGSFNCIITAPTAIATIATTTTAIAIIASTNNSQ